MCDDIYDFIRRALDNLKYPAEWSNERAYNSLACVGGILRSFRFFRHESFYWNNRSNIDDVFSKLVEKRDIPTIFADMPRGGAGPKEFEKLIIKTADKLHKKRLMQLKWTS